MLGSIKIYLATAQNNGLEQCGLHSSCLCIYHYNFVTQPLEHGVDDAVVTQLPWASKYSHLSSSQIEWSKNISHSVNNHLLLVNEKYMSD
jgi:hypothetical protein